jgi:hypothetical protein
MPRFAAILLLGCALSACGGGDGGAGDVDTSPPSPTPTPTPTPAPAPTSFPLSAATTFPTIRATLPTQLSASGRPELASALTFPLSDAEAVTAGGRTSDLIRFGSTSFANGCSQGPRGAGTGAGAYGALDFCSGSFSVVPDKSAYGYHYAWTRLVNAIGDLTGADPGYALKYATFTRLRYDGIDWERKAYVTYHAYGFPTPPAAIPTSRSAGYDVRVYADSGMVGVKDSAAAFPVVGSGYVNIEFATGQVIMELTLYDNRDMAAGPALYRILVARGTLTPGTGRIAGDFDPLDVVSSGSFEGALFGPGGEELGIAFAINGPATASYSGRMIGVVMARKK